MALPALPSSVVHAVPDTVCGMTYRHAGMPHAVRDADVAIPPPPTSKESALAHLRALRRSGARYAEVRFTGMDGGTSKRVFAFSGRISAVIGALASYDREILDVPSITEKSVP